jgi:hypothetical protein
MLGSAVSHLALQTADQTQFPVNQARREFIVQAVTGGFALGFAPTAWSAGQTTPASGPTHPNWTPRAVLH